MRYFISVVAFFFFILSQTLVSQTDIVQKYLKMVAEGKVDDVKIKLVDLLAEYPNDPGVLLLQAVVIDDAFKAVEIYKDIVRKYPESQWADDAYWRIVQFYAVLRDTTRACQELEKFRTMYPSSEYLGPAADVVRSAVGLARRLPETSEVQRTQPNLKKPAQPLASENIEKKHHESDKKEGVASLSEARENPDNPDLIPPDKPEEPKATAEKKADTKDSYGLQVAVFASQAKAEEETKKFLSQRMRTEVIEKKVEGNIMYAVVIGNYSSKESAEAAKAIVQQQCRCNPIVIKK